MPSCPVRNSQIKVDVDNDVAQDVTQVSPYHERLCTCSWQTPLVGAGLVVAGAAPQLHAALLAQGSAPCALEAAASVVPPHVAPGLSTCQAATHAVSALYAVRFAGQRGHPKPTDMFLTSGSMQCCSACYIAGWTIQHHGCNQQSDSCHLKPDKRTHSSSTAEQLLHLSRM